MLKPYFYVVASAILVLFSCASPDVRTPAQTLQAEPEVPVAQKMNFINLSSYVKVPGPELSDEEFKMYQTQCHVQMVERLLDLSTRLQSIKNYPGKNIQVSPLRSTKLNSVTKKFPYKSWNFKFTVQDENDVKYKGYIYTETKKDVPKIFHHPDGSYEYQCWYGSDGWVYDGAQLKNSRGQLIFSSSCAQKMLKGKNIDERCKETK